MPSRLSKRFLAAGGFQAFGSRNFTLLWVGNLLSNIGSWMQNVAEPWLVLQLSNSPFLLGLDSFAGDAPIWLLILAGGVLADRSNRRRTILWFQGLQLACPVTLVIFLLLGKVSVALVVALSAIVGVTDALSGPSLMALIPSSVPEGQVPNAVALNSMQFNLSRVLGPLIAGAVMTGLGATACFALNAFSYLPLFLALALMRLPAAALRPHAGDTRQTAHASLTEALKLTLRTEGLRRPLLTVLFSGLFSGPLITFAPVLIRDSLHRGRGSFGGALSAYGVGGLVGAAVVLLLVDNRLRQTVSSWAAVAVALLMIFTAVLPFFGVTLCGFCLIGAGMVTSNAAANTIVQSSVESRLRGRMSSLYTLALRGSLALGSIVTGLVVARLGVVTGLLVNGLLAAAAQLWLMASRQRPVPRT